MRKKTGRNRGHPSRIPEEQTKFLSSFWGGWDEARANRDKNAMSTFYNNVTSQFLEKFGVAPTGTPTVDRDDNDDTVDVSGPSTEGTSAFDINLLDPELRHIGPSNTVTPPAAITFPAQPPTSNTQVPSSDARQSEWGKTRLVCPHPRPSHYSD